MAVYTKILTLSEYSNNAGVIDKDVVFHSFRHTLNTHLSNKGTIDRDILAIILGHAIPGMGNRKYRNCDYRKVDIAPLANAISAIDYGLIHPPFKL